jgi:hypothetical protein
MRVHRGALSYIWAKNMLYHKRAKNMLETNQFEYLYSIPDLFGRKFVDNAENQPAILSGLGGLTLPVEEDVDATDVDTDDATDADETTKLLSVFVRPPTHLDVNHAITDVLWRVILTVMKL